LSKLNNNKVDASNIITNVFPVIYLRRNFRASFAAGAKTDIWSKSS